MPGRFLGGNVAEVAEPVIILRPVNQCDIAAVSTGREIATVRDATIEPEIEPLPCLAGWVEASGSLLERDRLGRPPAQERSGPGRRQLWNILAPEVILRRLVDRVVFAEEIIHREATGKGLLIGRLRLSRCVKLARFPARFKAGHIL